MARRIKGSFCERVMLPKSAFDRKSFRWKRSGRSWVLTGCRRRHFKGGRCDNGLRAHVVLVKSNGSCPMGGRAVRKG
jgi:hypothetical protein